jgi:hypothetical protein
MNSEMMRWSKQARLAATRLTKRAQRGVPAEFRESFLRRNPVHTELLSWHRG